MRRSVNHDMIMTWSNHDYSETDHLLDSSPCLGRGGEERRMICSLHDWWILDLMGRIFWGRIFWILWFLLGGEGQTRRDRQKQEEENAMMILYSSLSSYTYAYFVMKNWRYHKANSILRGSSVSWLLSFYFLQPPRQVAHICNVSHSKNAPAE